MVFIIILIFLGLFFWLANFRVLNWHRDWPLILIFFGILSFFNLSPRSKKKKIITDLEKGKITPAEAEEKLKKL